MGIKGEANLCKTTFAESLQKLAENVEVIVGKKSTIINLEDKSKHLTVNLNFNVTTPPSQDQITNIVNRVKAALQTQSDSVEDSNDPIFNSDGCLSSAVLTGTTSTVLIQNRDYLFGGEGKPEPIKHFNNLPCEVKVNKLKIKGVAKKIKHILCRGRKTSN